MLSDILIVMWKCVGGVGFLMDETVMSIKFTLLHILMVGPLGLPLIFLSLMLNFSFIAQVDGQVS